MRVLSVQATPPVEGSGIDTDVANNNNLAWRNIKIVAPGDMSPPSFFIVRNISTIADLLTLRFEVPPEVLREGAVLHVTLDDVLTRAFRDGKGRLDGLRPDGKGGFLVAGPRAEIVGLLMAPREQGNIKIQLGPTRQSVRGDITITQVNAKGVQGGVTLRLADSSSNPSIGKLAVFLDLGAGVPHGNFSNAFNTGFSLNAGLEYMINSFLSAEGIFGYHHFPVNSFAGAITDDLNVYQFSAGAKLYWKTIPCGNRSIRLFVNAGPGGYKFSSTDTYFGGNVGAGVLFNITSRFGLQGSYNFHVVNTPGTATKFSTYQGGIRFIF